MPRGILRAYQPELVQVLTEVRGVTGTLGSVTTTWTPGPDVAANVQPLGSDEAVRLGLTADRERLRVRLPDTITLRVAGRVRARGRDWRVIRSEDWQSFTLVIVEGL